MMKKLDQEIIGPPLLSQNISIVEVGAYSHIFEKFIDFIGVKSLIITDIDSAKKIYEKNTEGKEKEKIEKSRVLDDESCITTNDALKYFFAASYNYYSKYYDGSEAAATTETNISVGSDMNELVFLRSLQIDGKLLRKDIESKQWVQSSDGNVLVIYQTLEANSLGVDYHARSFEDSFIHLNRDFIKDNKEHFNSLKNKKYLDQEGQDPYFLADKCVDKKPSFAIDILRNSKEDLKTEFSNWVIPGYIKEGLLWLKNN